jgi:hypothetical protein
LLRNADATRKVPVHRDGVGRQSLVKPHHRPLLPCYLLTGVPQLFRQNGF